MAELIVISFDTQEDARGAYQKVQDLNVDLVVELAGIALVTSDTDGKTHVETPASAGMVGLGVAGGALFGTLIGILFFVPFLGLAFGGALGALFASLDKSGINGEFRERVHQAVRNGKPTLVIYATKLTEDKFGEALAPFHGTIAQTSLSEDQEKELVHDLSDVG